MTFTRMDSVGVIGIMSGTSLDGLDLCFVRFTQEKGCWRTKNLITKAIDYSSEWRLKLARASSIKQDALRDLDMAFGEFIASEVNCFIREHKLQAEVDLIASHGHTIFHEPAKGITVQIGNGQVISDLTGKIVINDFRSKDVSLGGQGAPLVPIGDQFLFGEYASCLNLGGIANISFEQNDIRIAFDIVPCNLPLNRIMRDNFGLEYDANGDMAKSGQINQDLLEALNKLAYYCQAPPKSLGIEWLNAFFYPILEKSPFRKMSPNDLLRTIVEHETTQIARIIDAHALQSVFATGGGAFNHFFIEELKCKTHAEIKLPSREIIAFKEALIFAFLGLRGVRGEVNALKSVTGASRDSVGGVISYPSTV